MVRQVTLSVQGSSVVLGPKGKAIGLYHLQLQDGGRVRSTQARYSLLRRHIFDVCSGYPWVLDVFPRKKPLQHAWSTLVMVEREHQLAHCCAQISRIHFTNESIEQLHQFFDHADSVSASYATTDRTANDNNDAPQVDADEPGDVVCVRKLNAAMLQLFPDLDLAAPRPPRHVPAKPHEPARHANHLDASHAHRFTPSNQDHHGNVRGYETWQAAPLAMAEFDPDELIAILRQHVDEQLANHSSAL
ncbi:hypothetical protein SPRG_04141 [Saprolegnia parasitica CBS 223.65]|uniref:Uncharacterized protein n=1 Tax=Saprolegnia parasitica (strain CBS 223.65) TaxID=695850 RepID=A0A067CKA2_SAPPC|nr:hypothetical protein SPRG_04141 [Saprolegnia parasitica CBS 223.65]KDO30953.1 hypothetical protein SPRG_04141 [Saprolegnia parasitica CBS 223.65]|eukprot:XP_012198137.1 hypothetical protein SPRG_04141 [Saprolegnia parasitica CBS 223.65]